MRPRKYKVCGYVCMCVCVLVSHGIWLFSESWLCFSDFTSIGFLRVADSSCSPWEHPRSPALQSFWKYLLCLGNRLSLSLIFLDTLHSLTQCASSPASWQSWCHPECSSSSLTWFSISLLLSNIDLLAMEFAYWSSSRLHHSAPPKCFLMPLDDHEQGSVARLHWDQLSPQLPRDWDMIHLHLHAMPAKTMCWGRCLQISGLMRMGLSESSCWTSVTQGFS